MPAARVLLEDVPRRQVVFTTDFATARAIRRSLKLPAQEPEPLAHGPPHEIELLDQIA